MGPKSAQLENKGYRRFFRPKTPLGPDMGADVIPPNAPEARSFSTPLAWGLFDPFSSATGRF
ncbi:hypothetical protein RRF57_013296 [Xylaria bambusicola]|uniref:Uncharacterized protein n=1 Tax=Xylaria bambusicola TaxID=326684 RepID=A0AAN7ZE79_9PEZI